MYMSIYLSTEVFISFSPVDMVALACLHLKLCDPEPAHVALTSIPQRELTKICICHHQLLHQDFTELSPLSQVKLF